MDTESGCGDICEEEAGVLVRGRNIEFAANSEFSSVVSIEVVMLDNQKCFFKGSFSVEVEDTFKSVFYIVLLF